MNSAEYTAHDDALTAAYAKLAARDEDSLDDRTLAGRPKTYKITGTEQEDDDDYPVKVTFNVVAKNEQEARMIAIQKVDAVRKIELVEA